jgi:hypothetical protein
MGEIIPVIQAIIKGIKSPYQAAAGAVAALLFYFFVLAQKGELRDRKAESEKDEQKGESNTQIENTNAQAEGDVRDQLGHRK